MRLMKILYLVTILAFSLTSCKVVQLKELTPELILPAEFEADLSTNNIGNCPIVDGKFEESSKSFSKIDGKYEDLESREYDFIKVLAVTNKNAEKDFKVDLDEQIPKNKQFFEILQPSEERLIFKFMHESGKLIDVIELTKNSGFKCIDGYIEFPTDIHHGASDGMIVNSQSSIRIRKLTDGSLFFHEIILPYKKNVLRESPKPKEWYYKFKSINP